MTNHRVCMKQKKEMVSCIALFNTQHTLFIICAVSGQQNTNTLFPPAVFAMAQSAENSCNAVLKAVAETILNNA